MEKRHVGWLVVCGLLASCGDGELVGLNQRLFELPSMASAGKGCSRYRLGGGETAGSSGGSASGVGLTVSERTDANTVVVDVSDGAQVVAHRVYDQAFFRAGTVDELVAMDGAGRQLLVRHWGRADEPFCTSLDVDSP